jgi:hypothetical protein
MLVKNGKFEFPENDKSIENYKKNNPRFKDEIQIDLGVWDWGQLLSSQLNGGVFYDGKLEEIDIIDPAKITIEYLLKNYNHRAFLDKSERPFLVKDGKIYLFENTGIFDIYKNNSLENKRVIRLNKRFWDWKTIDSKSYFGGFYKP